nr:MAG TPA: hypothetical protein [Caudoviricetes sp.]
MTNKMIIMVLLVNVQLYHIPKKGLSLQLLLRSTLVTHRNKFTHRHYHDE